MMSTQAQAHPSPYPAMHAYQAPLQNPPCVTSSSYHQWSQQQLLPSFETDFNKESNESSLANAYMNPTLPQPPSQWTYSPHAGMKRSASVDDELEQSSHISNHFKKLRLHNHRSNLSRPQPPSSRVEGQQSSTHAPHDVTPPEPLLKADRIPHLPSNDFMTVDETPDRVYISDLDSEIAAIEATEHSSSQLFLPDFEKQIGAIPDHVLRSNWSGYNQDTAESSQANSQALVLYKDPSSISVPEEEDVVRKAIIETRRGIRERMRRQQQKERESAHLNLPGNTGGMENSNSRAYAQRISSGTDDRQPYTQTGSPFDPDAMDIE